MRVLSVVHDPAATGGGGLFERVVLERGDHLDRWIVSEGDAAPGDPTHWDAVMVFGGAMHPDQDAEHPWLQGEVSFIQRALADGVPTIGVCLGAQLLARAAGAWVGPAESAEVGWFAVDVNDEGSSDSVLGVLPRRVEAFQWHYYTFALPDGARELARSATVRQAFRLGERAWGIQFHAEVDRRMLDRWLVMGASELPKPIDDVRAETDRLLAGWNEHGRALANAFLDEARRLASGAPAPAHRYA
ncbi:MAG TPA: type 1 glutamine amidotransferase [Gaiella sp.]|jgi:GMP synthase-like glutamine amidotransferase|nr:type 1 glutamine amidotransferase [Gaiella sp.]